MLEVYLNKNEEKEKLEGFPWIFNNEVNHFKGNINNGEVVKVLTIDGSFVCYGFINTASKIMVRILSLDENEVIDEDFFRNRIKYAISHRENLNFTDSNCYRLIFAEADFLPGLIVDKYADYLSVQFLCLGMDKIKDTLVKILVEETKCKGIYERGDVEVRHKEGLEIKKGFLYNEFDPRIEVLENGIKFIVDVAEGQKTGYFLDQKFNRDIMRLYAKDKVVLDCFSNVGGFALHACKYGAKEVYAVDISKKACDDIMYNANLNGFKQMHVICQDVFETLRSQDPNKFEVVLLDPPAFVKNKDSLKRAYKGYKEINLQALKLIKSGGYLLTFSCSQHMTPNLFMDMLRDAIHDSKRKVQFIDFRIQSPDHPSLMNSEEQLYLKCVILRVL
jgi:23S rRNA (cytosine1962-C5)-methyltransferase